MKKLPVIISLLLVCAFLGAYTLKYDLHRTLLGDGPIVRFIDKTLGQEQPVFDTSITGQNAPTFILPKLDGGTVNLDDHKGKYVMLNFWASWCPPCRAEIPGFIEAQEKYQDKGLTFIGVAIEDKENVESYAEEVDFNYPITYGVEDAYKVSGKYGNPDGALPYTIFISPEQKVLEIFSGFVSEEALEELLSKHLK